MERISISNKKYLAMIALIALFLTATAILAYSTASLQFLGLPAQYNAGSNAGFNEGFDAGSAAGYKEGFKAGELDYPESEPLLVTMVVNLSEAPTGSLLTLNSSVVVESVTFSFSHKVEKCEGGKEEVTVEFEVDVKVDATVNLSVLANGTPSPWTLGPDERFITLDIVYDIATGVWMVTERTFPFP